MGYIHRALLCIAGKRGTEGTGNQTQNLSFSDSRHLFSCYKNVAYNNGLPSLFNILLGTMEGKSMCGRLLDVAYGPGSVIHGQQQSLVLKLL